MRNLSILLLLLVTLHINTYVQASGGGVALESKDVTKDALLAEMLPFIIELYTNDTFFSQIGSTQQGEIKKTAILSALSNAGKTVYWGWKATESKDVQRTIGLINMALGIYAGRKDGQKYYDCEVIAQFYKDPANQAWLASKKNNRSRDQMISFAGKLAAFLLANYDDGFSIPLVNIKVDKATVPYLAVTMLCASYILDAFRLNRSYQIMVDKPLEDFEKTSKLIKDIDVARSSMDL